MSILIGAFLGYAVGLGAWLAARHFAAHSGSGSEPATRRTPLLHGARGAISLPAALAQAGLALWGAYLGWRAPGLDQVAIVLLVSGVLVAISLVDFQTRRIPNPLVLALLVLALVQVLLLGQPAPGAVALGLAVGGGLFLLAALIGRGAMGAGDVKLAAALGAVLGFPLIVPGLVFGALAGGVAAALLLITRRAGRKDFMAYGPYLALGAWLVWTQSLGLWA